MVSKDAGIRGRVVMLFFILLLIIVGFGGYFYYIRHKEPTQGIFVYDFDIRREEFVSGHLY